MNPFAPTSSTSSSASGSSNPFAPKAATDLNSSIGLYNLALAQGGTIAQSAEELVHPSTSILATIGKGFKNAFSKFVDLISIPNEVIAGVLSSKYSVPEAIKNHIRTSDVIFGDQDPNNTTMKKVGSWLVRTATDIILDPLTYVGELPFKAALQSISVGEKGALALGKSVEEAGFVTQKISRDVGTPLYQALTAQANGTAKAEELFNTFTKGLEATGKLDKVGLTSKEVATAAQSELDKLILKQSIDAPLDIDFAKKAMSNLIESHPALAETILDKGGLKYFGKTILSGQRISSALQLIPGMTLLDEATQPMRRFLSAPFDPAVIKDTTTGKYVRLPEEFVALKNTSAKMAEQQIQATYRSLENIVKENKLTISEARNLSDNLLAGTMPADERLGNAYKQFMSENENQLKWMQESGVPIARRESFGMPLVQEKVSDVKVGGGKVAAVSKKAGASFERTSGKFTDASTGEIRIGTPEGTGLIRKNTTEEIQRMTQTAEKNIEARAQKVEDITSEIQKLHAFVAEAGEGKVVGEFSKIIDSLPVADQENARQFINVLKDQMPKADIEQLTKTFAQDTMEQGVKIEKTIATEADKMSPEALQLLKEKIAKGELQLPGDIKNVNEALAKATPNINKAKNVVTAADAEDEVVALAKKLKLQSSAKRFSQIGKEIDQEALFKFADAIQKQFEANPTGVRKILNQIIGGKQQIIDLTNEIELERTIAKQNISELPQAKEFFVDAKDPNKLFLRTQATMSELKDAGFKFEANSIVAAGIRATDNARVGSMTRMIRGAGEMFGKLESEAPEGWRALNVGKETSARLGLSSGETDFAVNVLGKNSEQMVFHPAIAQALEDTTKAMFNDDATADLLKYFDKVQSLWKAGVTSIFPAFHGRNAISNVFQNFLDIGYQALNPASHGAAGQLVYDDKIANKLERMAFSTDQAISAKAKEELAKHLNTVRFTDVTGHDWTTGELRTILKKKGIAFVGGTGAIDVDTVTGIDDLKNSLFGAETKAGKAKNVAGKILNAPIDTGRLVGSIIEDQAKVLNFITNLKATGDVNHAAARTAMFLFDYGNLTNFEKTFLKRVIPFYTFTRKNIELQARMLLENPGRISQEIHGLTNLGQAISGGNLSQEDQDKLPNWIKAGINVLGSKNGNKVSIFGSFGTPIEQPFAALQMNQILGSVSPIIRLPIEQATGYSWFQQKPLSDVSNAAAFKGSPQVIKDFIGYTEVKGKDKNGQEYTFQTALHPENMNILNNLPFYGRVMSSLKQMENADVPTQHRILQQLIGVRPYSFDLEQEQNKKELNTQAQLKDLLTKAGVTAQFTRTYLPKKK